VTRTTPAQRSFSAGEIDPLLAARTDYQRTQTGLGICNGFLPLVQGGVTRAPGTLYRGRTKDDAEAVLVPFIFAADDACVLEFTQYVMRVWRYGALVETSPGVPYELATNFRNADLPNLRWQQTADVVYLVDGYHRPQALSRLALDNWTIAAAKFDNGPFRLENDDQALTLTASAASGAITLTASAALFVADHDGSLFWLTPSDLSTIPYWLGNEAATVGDRRIYDEKIYELMVRTPANVGPTPPVHISGTVAVQSGVSWKYISDLDGIVRITAVTDSTHATATVLRRIPEGAVGAPTYRWAEGAWSSKYGYPSAVQLYDQRLVFAANLAEPRSIWFSTAGDFTDWFPGTLADQAFAFTVAGDGSINRILNLKSGKAGLHVLALGQEFSTRAESRNQVIGPTNAVFGLDSAVGSAPAPAITPYGSPIFIARDKARVAQIAYSLQADANEATVLSRPSQHLGAKGFEEIEWTSSPQPMAWIRRTNGDIVTMVYDPPEDVLGFARLTLAGGRVKSMAVTPNPVTGEDVVTAVIQREINGITIKAVEDFAPWYGILTGDMAPAEAQHFFCAATFVPGTATATFSLPHLAGQEVYAWTDLGECGPFLVPGGGTVTLPDAVTRAHIGLFDTGHYIQTLDIQAAAPDGAAQGRQKRLQHRQTVSLSASVQGEIQSLWREIGEADGISDRVKLMPAQVAGQLIEAFTGQATVDLMTPLAKEVFLRIRPFQGAPLTVTAIIPKVSEEGA
jgi:hypothetical protein